MERDYKSTIKVARQAVWAAWKAYRFEVKKQRLLKRHADLTVQLKDMGVVIKQIPVVVYDGTAQRVKVSHVEPVAVSTRKKKANKRSKVNGTQP